MSRRRPIRTYNDSETEEDIIIPAEQSRVERRNNESSRIVNPNQPSTSAAARQKHYARKSTSVAPHGRNAPIREHISHSQNTEETSPERRSDRVLSRAQAAATNKTSNTNAVVPRNHGQYSQRQRKQTKPVSRNVRMLNEIRKLQMHQGFLIPRAPFGRLLREIMRDASSEVSMITKTALEGIQEACETYMVQVLTDAYALTLHRERVTLMVKDIQLLRVIRVIP